VSIHRVLLVVVWWSREKHGKTVFPEAPDQPPPRADPFCLKPQGTQDGNSRLTESDVALSAPGGFVFSMICWHKNVKPNNFGKRFAKAHNISEKLSFKTMRLILIPIILAPCVAFQFDLPPKGLTAQDQLLFRHDDDRVTKYTDQDRTWRFPDPSHIRQSNVQAPLFEAGERTWRNPSVNVLRRKGCAYQKYDASDRTWRFPDPSQTRHLLMDQAPIFASKERMWRTIDPKQLLPVEKVGKYTAADRTWRFPDASKVRHPDDQAPAFSNVERTWRKPSADVFILE
jgi:hypothetical protein